jgi:hypothetical protein
MSGSRRSTTQQSNGLAASRSSASPPIDTASISMSSWPTSSTIPWRSMSLSSTTRSRRLWGSTYVRIRSNACSRSSVVALFTDLVILPGTTDLSLIRAVIALIAVSLLLYGLIWDAA